MMIVLNPNAGGGTAVAKWHSLVSSLPRVFENATLCALESPESCFSLVRNGANLGERHFVAAGGDGTVHLLLNAIMQLPSHVHREIVLGAVGLGSSNDFHKPFENGFIVDNRSLKLDFQRSARRDVGVAVVQAGDVRKTRYFLINASAGLTAEGNRLFNQPDRLLAWLKLHSPSGAILYAALHACVRSHNRLFTMRLPSHSPWNARVTNLGIVKNPHFSGSLHYGVPAAYDDGQLQLFVAMNLGILRRLLLLMQLSIGRFPDWPSTIRMSAERLALSSSTPFPLELDGEIIEAEQVEFSVLQNSIRVCP